MSDAAVEAHVRALNDCNQRGGRMLSLVDLIDAGTVDLPMAAYLAAVMRSGASLLVGARPGGAGKTTVMCALLNFLPDSARILPVDSPAVLAEAERDPHVGRTCFLAHEIGAGSFYAYLWGREAQAFFRLASRGHLIASNLHTDTVEETHEQLCEENGVSPPHVAAVRLKAYIQVKRRTGAPAQRRMAQVYESDGTHDHLVWELDPSGRFVRRGRSGDGTEEQEQRYAEFITTLSRRSIRHIEEIRHALIHSDHGAL
jgi:hypothetical protein